MADIELVIKVSEEIYNHTQEYEVGGFNQENDTKLFMAIKNSIPLPKGHGRLIDADALVTKGDVTESYLNIFAPTIIEADNDGQAYILDKAKEELER